MTSLQTGVPSRLPSVSSSLPLIPWGKAMIVIDRDVGAGLASVALQGLDGYGAQALGRATSRGKPGRTGTDVVRSSRYSDGCPPPAECAAKIPLWLRRAAPAGSIQIGTCMATSGGIDQPRTRSVSSNSTHVVGTPLRLREGSDLYPTV